MVDRAELVIENDVMITMRDGVRLRADVFRPSGDERHPVLVQRYPYTTRDGIMAMFAQQIAQQGYAVVVQSCRGRFGSEGRFEPFVADADDSFDTVEWAAEQPWSNGRVGMYGVSYSGMTQWSAALSRPPHLVCIAPMVCTWDWTVSGWYFSPGVLTLGLAVAWSAQMAPHEAERQDRSLPGELSAFDEAARIIDSGGLADPGAMEHLMALQRDAAPTLLEHRPLRDFAALTEFAPWFADWCDHPDPDDEYWQAMSGRVRAADAELPVLNVAGWYDYFTKGGIEAFERRAGMPGQRLVVGPWNHNGGSGRADAGWAAGSFFDFSPTAPVMRFFDHHLKGEHPGFDAEPPVRVFVMGENVWRDEHEWPLARTSWTDYDLRADGTLAPGAEEPAGGTSYVHDPRDPVPGPIAIGATFGDPPDLTARAERSDVLVFHSAPSDAPLELTGPVRVDLWVSSTAPTADFVANLVEVQPDGTLVPLCQGVTRGDTAGGEPTNVQIDLASTSVLLPVGSSLRLDVSSSLFPTFELNPGTGSRITHDTALAVSTQTVFFGAEHRSRLTLPIIPR